MKVVGHTTPGKIDQLISKDLLDKDARRRLNQQLEEIERAIFAANEGTLRIKVPSLDRANFVHFASLVADTRANYIKMALEISRLKQQPDATIVQELKRQREAYEELLAAFEAMQRVIERGYVRLDK
jgi:uncharacterized protein YjaG (DUF416 family)